jgi:hypothetical protein
MRRRLILLALPAALAPPAPAQPVLPLAEVAARVAERYHGRMIEARVVPGREDERIELVYELRWLTPGNQVLRIRVSAIDGGMLLVEGPGMTEARR